MSDNLQNIWTPFKIILVYIFFGSLWILLSDELLAQFVNDAQVLTNLQIYKGWFFTLVTAVLLYGLIKRSSIRQKQIEKAHLNAALKYSELVENAQDLIFTADRNGNFKSINKAGEEITGYKREEFLKLNFSDIVADEDAKYLQMLFTDLQIVEYPSIEIKIRRKNGQKRILEVKNKLYEEADEPLLIQGIARDITERKLNDEKLKVSETQLRNLVETANEGIWTLDEAGNINFVNEKLAKMLGYERAEMLGTFYLDYVEDEMKIAAERNFNRRRSGIGEQIDYKLKKSDGSTIWVIAATNPIFRNNDFDGVLAMMNDITDRRNDEEEKAKLSVQLKSQKTYLNYIISSIPGIVWENRYDPDAQTRKTVFVSDYAEKMLGYKVSDWIQTEDFWEKIIHPEDRENITESLKKTFDDPAIKETIQNYRWLKKDGNAIWVETRMQIERDQNGHPIAARGVTFDITEQKEAAEKLRLSEERFRSLVSATSQMVWFADAAGKLTSAQDFRGHKLEDATDNISEYWAGQVHPEDRAKAVANVAQAIAERRAYFDEYRLYQEKEKEYHYYVSRGVPIFEKDGKLREWIGTLTDKTKEVLAEKQSKRNADRYLALASSVELFWIAEADGRVIKPQVAPANVTEIDCKICDTDFFWWLNVVHPDERKETEKKWMESIETGKICEMENRILDKNGQYIHIFARGIPVFEANGKIREWVGMGVNITERKKIEKALEEKQRKLDFALEAGKLGAWFIDLRDNSMTYSEVLLENLGLSSEAGFSFEKLQEMIHPDDLELHRQAFIKTVKTGEEFRLTHRVVTVSGEIRWVEVRGEAEFNENRRAITLSGTARNITESKLAEEALRESENRLNTVIENIAEGLIISDMNGNLLLWNKASLQMHGFTKENEHLRPFEDFASLFELSTLDGRVLDLNEWAISRVIKGEKLRNFEVRIRRKDIEWERIFCYGGDKVKDASGKEILFLTISDITDKKHAEEELKKLNDELEKRVIERTKEVHRSEERLRLIGDHGTDGYWDWNLLTDETYLSPSFKALFGYEDNELPNVASSWQNLLHPEDRERAAHAYVEHINENKPYDLQVRYRHKNGSIVWVNCRGVALKNDDGEFVRMVGTHINITQQKLAEEALYKLNSQLEQRVLEKTKEVRQSELHFRQLSEGLPLLVWTCSGENGMCDYLSRQWVEYTGISEDVQLGFEWIAQIHPEDRERVLDYWKNQAEKSELFESEFRIRRYDGVYRWFQTRAMPFKDANGKVIKWFGTNVDIDDRKLNEQIMQLLQDLSVKVGKSESLETALKEILEEVRSATGWEVGEVWMPDDRRESLELVKSAFKKDELLEDFSKYSSEIKFGYGKGLPGIVWKSKESLWMQDIETDKNFFRRERAVKAGIKTGIGIPILIQDEVLGVFIFFSKKSNSEDERKIRLITSVASQIGEYLQRKKAENDLRQSRRSLQLGIGIAKMAIIEVDLPGNICKLSPEAVELFGFSEEKTQITREELRGIIHQEDLARVVPLVERAMNPASDGLLEVEHRIVRTDGEVRWLAVKEQFYFVNKEVPHKAVLVFLDITESKKMEESIRSSEERLRRLQKIVSDYELSYKERIAEIIRLGTEIFGFESGVLGEITNDRYRVLQSVSEIADYTGYECALSDTICDATIQINDTLVVEDVSKSRFSETAALKLWGLNSYFGTQIEKSNKLFGTICFISQHTLERKLTTADEEFLKIIAHWIGMELTRNEAEEALRESEERFRVLFDQSPAGKVIVDLETMRFAGCNSIATEILGYTSEELSQYYVKDLDTFKTEKETEEISEIVRQGGKVQYETVNRAKSGELKNLLVVSAGIFDKGKKYSYSSFVDITEKKKAEAELERERERFEKIAAVSPSIIHSFNLSPEGVGSFPYISQAVEKIYGLSPEELKEDGTKLYEMIVPQDRRKIGVSIERSKQSMQPWNHIWRINNPEKGEIWIEGHSSPVNEKDGSITWHGILTDVTERTRQANELAERERLIRAIFNTAPSLIVLWDVVSGKISYTNNRSKQILGIEPEEVVKLSRKELFDKIHAEDFRDAWRFILKLLKAPDGEILTHEYRYLHPTGEWRVFLSQDTVFERDENGKVTKTLNIIEDITERKTAERALRESEERFVKAFESNPAGVSFIRLSDCRIIDVNLSFEKLLGYASEELIGHSLADMNIWIEPFDSEGLQKFFREKATSKNQEISLRTKTGRIIEILLSNESIELNGEQCVLSIIYDITDRKRAEEELRRTEEKLLQAQKLESVGRLAGGIAHDFNNMLTAINGYADLTLRQISFESPLRHNLEEIHKAGQRSAELTQQLLAFSRKSVLKPEITNLNTVVVETSTLLNRLIGEDVKLKTVLRSEIDDVKVDPSQLSQVIVNLAVNARDAMPKGGILTIETSNVALDGHFAELVGEAKAGDYVMLTVSDTGIGMSMEEKEHIFEPFYTTKDVGKGTGLGLATVYGFVKQSDGYIWVYSEPNHGTSFKIYLPAVSKAEKKVMKNANKETITKGSETILLVEDEDLVRNLNREILESYGYKVIEARNGVEALKIYAEGGIVIDLLMTDVVMPEMGGSELASKLAETHPDLKVLFTSGYTDDAVVRHGVIDESANFLQKPFSLDSLLNKVREILDR